MTPNNCVPECRMGGVGGPQLPQAEYKAPPYSECWKEGLMHTPYWTPAETIPTPALHHNLLGPVAKTQGSKRYSLTSFLECDRECHPKLEDEDFSEVERSLASDCSDIS